MISQKQLAANRRNALKSTGPKTRRGKARSAMNALKHGFLSKEIPLSTESPTEFKRVQRATLEALTPENAMEFFLAEKVLASMWHLRRILHTQREILESAIEPRRSAFKNELYEKKVDEKVEALRQEGKNIDDYINSSQVQDDWDEMEDPVVPLAPLMQRMLEKTHVYCLLDRYETKHERSMYRALRWLQLLRGIRMAQSVIPTPMAAVDVNGSTVENN